MRRDINTLLEVSEPHFVLARGGVPEVVVSGVAYLKIEGGRLFGSEPSAVMIPRSLLKPWQFLAADVPHDSPCWALGLASHSGQPRHMEALTELARLAGAGEEELFCPRALPLDPNISAAMRSRGEGPSRLMHPCSGKHLVALAACRTHGFPTERYWDIDHPLQKKLAALVGRELGEEPIWLTDSCGLPTVAMTCKAHLAMWERLGLSDDPKVRALKQLWVDNPRLIGGVGRLDSDLMEVAPGKLLAKEGADGLLMVQTLPDLGAPVATCLIKLAAGYNSNYLALALWSLLSRAPEIPPPLFTVRDYLRSRLEAWVPRDQELSLPPFGEVGCANGI